MSSIKKNMIPALGVDEMLERFTGWTVGDGTSTEGYNVADYFDSRGRYRGTDKHGIEPTFREMTDGEVASYLGTETKRRGATRKTS